MHVPPPVQITCGDSVAWRLGRTATSAAAAAAFAAWAAGWWGTEIGPWVAAAAVLALAPSMFGRRRELRCLLVWDGQRWALDGRPGTPQVMIDLGRWMLLRFREAEGRPGCWLTVEAARAGASFHLWRAALYSPAAQPTPTSP